MTPAPRRFLSIDDLSAEELVGLLDDADALKDDPASAADRIAGRQVVLIFEKPSTRTRVSFEVAVSSMGGHAVVLRGDELQLGRGETVADTGRVLSRYADAIVVRTFGHDRLEELAAATTVPVINALSDFSHPCQALADLQTIREHKGRLEGIALAYLGDGNNVAHSLMYAGAKTGMEVRIACPPGYQPSGEVVDRCNELNATSGGRTIVTDVVAEAASGADVLYTDVWASMGQEAEEEQRTEVFGRYQLNSDSLGLARDDSIVMHCLPAHRGLEITEDVIDGERSVVWDQAENRLHTQRALLARLLG